MQVRRWVLFALATFVFGGTTAIAQCSYALNAGGQAFTGHRRNREHPHHGASGMHLECNRHSGLGNAHEFRDWQRQRNADLSGRG